MDPLPLQPAFLLYRAGSAGSVLGNRSDARSVRQNTDYCIQNTNHLIEPVSMNHSLRVYAVNQQLIYQLLSHSTIFNNNLSAHQSITSVQGS